ncbi:MAG: hypothetical protein JSS32_00500 [Verrucomicrobia bacterium]|nr:hypothetical protein [Verrucomicrobiota bacterium]
MNFFKILLTLFATTLVSCHSPKQGFSYFDFIASFTKKNEEKNKIKLSGCGINSFLPKEYKIKNGIANFNISFKSIRSQEDPVSLEKARRITVTLVEDLLNEINTNPQIRPYLDCFPMTIDHLQLSIWFWDENSISLGKGISDINFSKGEIDYFQYEIYEYSTTYPAVGRQSKFFKESYQEALEKVKGENALTQGDVQ